MSCFLSAYFPVLTVGYFVNGSQMIGSNILSQVSDRRMKTVERVAMKPRLQVSFFYVFDLYTALSNY